MKRFLAVTAMLLVLGASARADSFTVNWGSLQDSSTGPLAVQFNAQDTTSGVGFKAFCVDLTDEVNSNTAYITGSLALNSIANTTPVYNIAGVGNKLGYLLTQVWEKQGNVNSATWFATVQYAIWDTADGGDIHNTAVDAILAQLTNGDYVAKTNYQAGTFQIVPASGPSAATVAGPLEYQVMIGINPVPEPSTFAIAGLGALGLLGYRWKRRKSS